MGKSTTKEHDNRKNPTPKEQSKFFIDHAFFFLAHRDEIMADSRMYLARVPVVNGLAYTNTVGFEEPTLGVYLEWWAECDKAVFEEDGERWLVWRILGSLLTSYNNCSAVNEKGETKIVFISHFKALWMPFVKINKRYKEAKASYACYTLEKVADILSRNDKDKDKQRLVVDCLFLRSRSIRLGQKLQKSEEHCEELQKKLAYIKIRLDADWYRRIYHKFKEAKKVYTEKMEYLSSQLTELRQRQEAGELTDAQYQRLLRPVSAGLKYARDPVSIYDDDVRHKDSDVTLHNVVDYFDEEEKNAEV